jgi:alkyl hydroperoxide reductase subunit AhpC
LEYAKTQSFGVIVINSNEAQRNNQDSYAAMQQYAKEQDYNFPYVTDKDSEVANAYGATRTPEVFLIDNTNKVVYKGAIDDSPGDASAVKQLFLKQAIDAVATGNTITVKESKSIGCTIKRVIK